MTKKDETKGKFKLIGIVSGLNEESFREGVTASGKDYRSVSFNVQTSETNKVRVELFGMVKDRVFLYSQKDKETKEVTWEERNENHGSYKLLGTNMKLEKDKAGKAVRKVMAEYDAIEYMEEMLKDGMSVAVTGRTSVNSYENDEGEKRTNIQLQLSSISLMKNEIDFEDEEFKETCNFEQEVVIVEVEDNEDGKTDVYTKLIDYKGDAHDVVYTVNKEELPKLAQNMKKRMKFGDFIKVYGVITNKVELVEGKDEDLETDEDDWGGDDELTEEMEKSYITNYIVENEIRAVKSSTYVKGKYSQEDFENADEDAFDGDENFDDDDFGEDFDDEDLPF